MGGSIGVEGRLEFSFDNSWTALKWDADPAYLEGLHRAAEGTRAVDILGVLNGSSVWLIEVKDPRGARISFRSTRARLPEVVSTKVRDTIAALTWVHGRVSSAGIPHLIRVLFGARSKERTVLLWLEDAAPGYALALKEEIGRELRWLNPRVLVTNRALFRQDDVPGLTVTSLKGAHTP
ncbi:MAG: hypothetical protein IT370_33830 [Deltaproteobacteria bacterium]|nr:hypothetical protein [Deltaproteobacteria bacterium]